MMRCLRVLAPLLGCLALLAASGCTKPPAGPTPTDTVTYTALGASDTIGVGGSNPCIPFDSDCPGGTGYVYLLKRRLQGAGLTVALNNRGVPGAVLSPAIQALTRQVGRDDVLANFIEQEVPFVPGGTTHITVFAGGNDVNAIAQGIRAGLAGGDIRGFIDRHVQQWGVDFDEMVRRIRARAGTARIVALNVPNMAGMPYVSRNTIEERSMVQRIAVGLADRVNATTAQNVLVVDLLCEPRLYSPANLSNDGFHPNDQGYQMIADLTYAALANGTAPAPSPNCSQRTLVPVF